MPFMPSIAFLERLGKLILLIFSALFGCMFSKGLAVPLFYLMLPRFFYKGIGIVKGLLAMLPFNSFCFK